MRNPRIAEVAGTINLDVLHRHDQELEGILQKNQNFRDDEIGKKTNFESITISFTSAKDNQMAYTILDPWNFNNRITQIEQQTIKSQ